MVNVSNVDALIQALTKIVNKNIVVKVTCDNKTIPFIVKRFEFQEKERSIFFGNYDCKRWEFGIGKSEITNVGFSRNIVTFNTKYSPT